jgi:hypothetical protein
MSRPRRRNRNGRRTLPAKPPSPVTVPAQLPMPQEPRSNLPDDSSRPTCANYLSEEQKQRRAEIERLSASMESDQRYGLLATGAVWTWLFTHAKDLPDTETTLGKVVSWLPFAVVAILFFRWIIMHRSIATIANYTIRLEWLANLPFGFGWENYVRCEDDSHFTFDDAVFSKPWKCFDPNSARHRSTHSSPFIVFWLLLLLTNFGLALAFGDYVYDAKYRDSPPNEAAEILGGDDPAAAA